MRKFFKKILAGLFVFLLVVGGFFVSLGPLIGSKADEGMSYTSVMQDLSKDVSFDKKDYPSNAVLQKLEVFQLAESANKELFVYVYQPSAEYVDFFAQQLSLSQTLSADGYEQGTFYPLRLVSSSGVFQKYLVENFVVPNDSIRYYFLSDIVGKINGSLKTFEVGQQWYVYDENGSTSYEMSTFDVAEVSTGFLGRVRYPSGTSSFPYINQFDSFDLQFLSFNADEDVMQHYYDIELVFKAHRVTEKEYLFELFTDYKNGSVYTDQVFLNTIDTVRQSNGKFFEKQSSSCYRVSTSADFMTKVDHSNGELQKGARSDVLSRAYVFSFMETSYSQFEIVDGKAYLQRDYINVSDLVSMRIYYKNFVDVYDLGLITDPVVEDESEDARAEDFLGRLETTFDDFISTLFLVVGLFAFGFVLSFFWPVLKPVFKAVGAFIGKLLKSGFKALVVVVKLPFVLIGKLFRWIFGKKSK